MVLTLNHSFEEGTAGASLDTHPDLDIVPPGSTNGVYSSAAVKSGALSARFTTTGTNCYVKLTATRTTGDTRYWSFYLRPVTRAAANVIVFYVGSALGGAGVRSAQVNLNADGTMKLQDTNAAIIGSNTLDPLPLNEWSRVDLSLVNGTATLAVYPGTANCDKAAGTATSGNVRTGAAGNSATSFIYYGVGTGTTADLFFDEFREDDSALPGPILDAVPNPDPEATVDWALYFDDGTQWQRVVLG